MVDRGREDVAEISRLSRALLTAWATAPDPEREPLITELIAEAGQQWPGNSLQYMAAIAVGLSRELQRTFAERGIQATVILEDIRRHRRQHGGVGGKALVDEAMDIVDAVAARPRDEQLLTECISRAGHDYGAYALAELTAIAAQLANDVALHSAGRFPDALAVIAHHAAGDEQSLYEQGEA